MASVFATAGVAAALAASLTTFVVPLGGARANPPASNVIVVNPATGPALTRNVDDPGRIAYQSEAACLLIVEVSVCDISFSEVPKNHRLVVQHVSIELTTTATSLPVTFLGGANGGFSSFIAQPGIGSLIQVDQPVLQYFDAGSKPILNVNGDLTLTSGNATISGYLLDCATTPCQPIAQ